MFSSIQWASGTLTLLGTARAVLFKPLGFWYLDIVVVKPGAGIWVVLSSSQWVSHMFKSMDFCFCHLEAFMWLEFDLYVHPLPSELMPGTNILVPSAVPEKRQGKGKAVVQHGFLQPVLKTGAKSRLVALVVAYRTGNFQRATYLTNKCLDSCQLWVPFHGFRLSHVILELCLVYHGAW